MVHNRTHQETQTITKYLSSPIHPSESYYYFSLFFFSFHLLFLFLHLEISKWHSDIWKVIPFITLTVLLGNTDNNQRTIIFITHFLREHLLSLLPRSYMINTTMANITMIIEPILIIINHYQSVKTAAVDVNYHDPRLREIFKENTIYSRQEMAE